MTPYDQDQGADTPRLGRYEILGEIASGGMATVFLARSVGAGGFTRLMAIKRLHPHLETDDDFVVMVDSNYHESRNKGRAADYVTCSEPSSKRAFYNTVTLKSVRPESDADVHGEWMGVVKFSQRGAKVVADKLRGLATEPERLRTMKLPDLLQLLIADGVAVRVIYTTGHWLDVDSVEDVVVGAAF